MRLRKAITGSSLERYHSSCLQLISSGKSRDYAKKIFDDAKQFVRWVYMQNHIGEMPRKHAQRRLENRCADKEGRDVYG